MNIQELKKASNILIYGYGVEGKSTAKFLSTQSISFEIHDKNIEEFSGPKKVQDYDVIVVSAGINRDRLPFPKKKMTSQTEIFFHSLTIEERRKVIGITGTKGKSTTAQLTHDMLKCAGKKVALAGNIGIGMLDTLEQISELDYIVLELSSFQLAYLDVPAHIVICTNLLQDHLDWHGSVKNYHKAKQNLWKYQDGGDVLFVPDHQRDLFPQRAIPCLPLGPNQVPADSLWQATHARQNFGMVADLAERLEMKEAFSEAIAKLKTLPHRQQTVATIQDITFIDNAIASNPHSTLADLKFFKDEIGSLILGGKDRGQNFTPLFQYISRYELDIHLIIEDSETIGVMIRDLNENFPSITYSDVKDMKEAVEKAFEVTPEETICLLSPASASWDKYKSYVEKGDDFKKWVLSYK